MISLIILLQTIKYIEANSKKMLQNNLIGGIVLFLLLEGAITSHTSPHFGSARVNFASFNCFNCSRGDCGGKWVWNICVIYGEGCQMSVISNSNIKLHKNVGIPKNNNISHLITRTCSSITKKIPTFKHSLLSKRKDLLSLPAEYNAA